MSVLQSAQKAKEGIVASTAPVDIGTLIHSRPDLHSGRPCLAGTGVTVHTIAVMHRQGMGVSDFQAEFPDLDVSLYYAALAYYFANRAVIDADLEADEKLYWELAAKRSNDRPAGDR
jgi:uncharacterized protein (DUF433 family)